MLYRYGAVGRVGCRITACSNPARGHLDKLLAKRQKLTRGHHAAMPFVDVPQFMAQLRQRDAMAALALEFTILTAARSGEALGARWDEIDFEKSVWTVPAARTKASRLHRIPLSGRALEILKKLDAARTGDFIFPGQRPGKPLSGMAMQMILRRMNVDGVTVHGFRSSFRDWCGEVSTFRVKWPRPRLCMSPAIRRSAPVGAAMRWRNGAG